MALVLYLATAALLLAALRLARYTVSRREALFLIILPALMTGRAMLTGRLVAPVDFPYLWEPFAGYRAELGVTSIETLRWSDVASQLVPWRHAVRDALMRGEWPLLNRYELSGSPLAASAQSAAFHPFTLVAALLPAAESFNYSASIVLFVAAFGAFAFSRDLGLSPLASSFAAAGWMLSSPLAFFALWPIGAAWAHLPLLLAATRRIALDPNRRNVFTLAVILSLVIFSGHPETLLHLVGIGVAYGIFELRRAEQRVRSVAAASAAGALALMLGAIYLLPLLEALPQTHERWIREALYAKTRFAFDPVQAVVRAATSSLPFLDGHVWNWRGGKSAGVDVPIIGSIGLALAGLALIRRRDREILFFAALLVVALCAAFDIPPVATILHAAPLFKLALNQRLAFAAAFAAVMLAAGGLDHLQQRPSDSANRGALLIAYAIAAAGAIWALNASATWSARGDWRVIAELAPIAAAAIVVVCWRNRAASALLILMVVQRSVLLAPLYPALPKQIAYPEVPLLRKIQQSGSESFRVVGGHLALVPNSSAMYGLEDVRGYQAMTLKRLVETYPLWSEPLHMWFNRVGDLERPFLSMMNVRFAIAPLWMGIPDGWREIDTDHHARLLENTRYLPRAFVPLKVRLGAQDVIAEMAGERDFAERAWIEAPQEPAERDNGPGTVSTRHADLGYDLQVDMRRNGWIVVSQAAWSGWRAYLDGRRVAFQRANHAFISVFVPAGRHRVRLLYLPQTFVVGRAITFLTLLVLAGLAAAHALKWRTPPGRVVSQK